MRQDVALRLNRVNDSQSLVTIHNNSIDSNQPENIMLTEVATHYETPSQHDMTRQSRTFAAQTAMPVRTASKRKISKSRPVNLSVPPELGRNLRELARHRAVSTRKMLRTLVAEARSRVGLGPGNGAYVIALQGRHFVLKFAGHLPLKFTIDEQFTALLRRAVSGASGKTMIFWRVQETEISCLFSLKRQGSRVVIHTEFDEASAAIGYTDFIVKMTVDVVDELLDEWEVLNCEFFERLSHM